MQCERTDICTFYKTHRYRMSARQYQLLVSSYCEGSLNAACRRKKFLVERGEEPPDELCPNGYRVGSHQKLY